MNKTILTVTIVGLLAGLAGAQEPMLQVDPNFTARYFEQTLAPAPPACDQARALAELMKAEVLELAEADWGPFYHFSWPVNQGGNRFAYFNCPDELLVALAMAEPLLDDEGRAAAETAATREFRRYFPLNRPVRPMRSGDQLRGWYDVPEDVVETDNGVGTWLDGQATALVKFKTLYGVWAYAEAFDQWEMMDQAWPIIRGLKDQLIESGYDFQPRWSDRNPDGPGILTAEVAGSDRYRHELMRFLLTGTHGFYGNNPPRDEHTINVFAQFGYTKLLSALIGYGRIAEHLGHDDEAAWARQTFECVAEQTLRYQTAPMYWSSPWLTPEVARMLRDHAGDWLDELAGTPNVFVGDESDGFANEGPWYRVIDAHHWYVTHLGSNGSVTPDSPMSGFLVQAWLFNAPAEDLDTWTDTPWCQADYWYIQKCAVAIIAYGQAGWRDLP